MSAKGGMLPLSQMAIPCHNPPNLVTKHFAGRVHPKCAETVEAVHVNRGSRTNIPRVPSEQNQPDSPGFWLFAPFDSNVPKLVQFSAHAPLG